MIFFNYVKNIVSRHYLAFMFFVVVGCASVAAQVLAIYSLGDDYRGIHLFVPDDNAYYVARMHDVLDGHRWINAPYTYEYKNQNSVLYPIGEYFYMLPTIVFGIPLVTTLIIDKFLFPAALFLLVYFLILELTFYPRTITGKLNAIAGGLFVTLGFNLVNYNDIVPALMGRIQPELLWTRPVNPITGAIFLFIFLIIIWRLINSRRIYWFIVGGAVFGMMIGYFFTWGVILAVLGIMAMIFLCLKKYDILVRLIFTVVSGFLFSAYYWYHLLRAVGGVNGNKLALQNGMLFTHQPLLNKVLIAALLFFVFCFLLEYFTRRKSGEAMAVWSWYCLSLLIGGLLALNQQIITGRMIWPYHFVQYTTPFAMVVFFVLLYNVVRPRLPRLWLVGVIGAIILSLFYGISAARGYRFSLSEFRDMQRYAGIFEWLNNNAPRDCVVLVREGAEERLSLLVSGFTACNAYVEQWSRMVVLDDDYYYHNFFVRLRINGVAPELVYDYLREQYAMMRDFFYRDWRDFYSGPNEPWLVEKTQEVTIAYRDFAKKDFASELQKHRLDYVVSDGVLDDETLRSVTGLRLVQNIGDFYVYAILEI